MTSPSDVARLANALDLTICILCMITAIDMLQRHRFDSLIRRSNAQS